MKERHGQNRADRGPLVFQEVRASDAHGYPNERTLPVDHAGPRSAIMNSTAKLRIHIHSPLGGADLYPYSRLDTGVNFAPQPRRGLHSIAVGKGTFFVPAAHGKLPTALPTLKGSNIPPLAGSPVGRNVGAEPSTPPGSRRGRNRRPWAAGTKNVPLPTAIQFLPLRGAVPSH
jgi:hypothetical protein